MDRMITPEELPGLVAGEVLLDSTRLDWENLQLRKFHSEPQELQGPMICDYTIVLYSDPAHQVCRRTDGSWKTYWVERGWVSVLTRAQTSQWRWDSHVTGTHAYLPYAALAPVAAEVFERDVEDIELHDIAAVQDLVLTEMVERLSNEASAGGLGGRLYVEALRTQLCIHLLRNYATLWQSGYSWRDVFSRPPAPDAIETTMLKGGKTGRHIPPPKAEDYGAQLPAIMQVHGDRLAIIKLLAKLPASERKLLPDVQQTADALYARANDLARTLHAMDTNLDSQELAAIDERIAGISREPDDPERDRRLRLLERQRQSVSDLRGRRSQVASHLESCVLAMQNVRFDLLRLRSAGVAAVLGDLTQATQQAKSLSRDVDNAIAAAGEIREVMK
jgi:hypothetical protein